MRLNAQLLSQLPHNQAELALPQYDRQAAGVGIVHLGIGAFHRAHQAVYTEEVMNLLGGNWRINACSLRSGSVREQLAAQDFLYTVMTKSESNSAKVVAAVANVLVGPENPQAIIDEIAANTTKVITLTITEKGYCHLPSSGNLNLSLDDIQFDIQQLKTHQTSVRTAIGYLVAGLNQRRQNQNQTVSLLSCDNLPHNGKVLQNVILQFAEQVEPELQQWIAQNVSFPCSMVDRIVPATTEDDKQQLNANFAYQDQGLVVAEPFSQWVIEDKFINDRPEWEQAGALLVEDVAPFEDMKLRLLNGSHSLLAYAGYLSGYETIYQAMQSESMVALCRQFMSSAATTLQAPPGFDVGAYQQQLIERFSNPGLKHRTYQIAMDGSQKVVQRWLSALSQLLQQDGEIMPYLIGLCAWLRYCEGVDEEGQTIAIQDPFAKEFADIAAQFSANPSDYVMAFLKQDRIFPTELVNNQTFVDRLTALYSVLKNKGIKALIKQSFV